MAELDDRYRDVRTEAERRAASGVTSVTDTVSRVKKAIVGFVTATGIPTLTLWLGAESPVVVAVTALAVTLGVYVVPNAVSPGQGEDVVR